MQEVYGEQYYTKRMRIEKYVPLARAAMAALGEGERIESAVDVGCANGMLSKAILQAFPLATCAGVDHGEIPAKLFKENIPSPNAVFVDADLDSVNGGTAMPDGFPRLADIVTCIEVLEHVAAANEHGVVEFLSSITGKVLFVTAAAPGQRGHGHVNCRPREHWIGLVEATGLSYSRRRTRAVQSLLMAADKGEHARNAMVFVRKTAVGRWVAPPATAPAPQPTQQPEPADAGGRRERRRSRMRSLAVDRNDESTLRYGRFRNMGTTVAAEYYQPCPFFFTREKWPLQIVGHFRGGSAFLIAGGPSFAAADKSLLRAPGVWTITLNNAVRSFRGNAACIVDDPTRFVASLWHDPTIMKFVPACHFEKEIWDNRTLVMPGGRRDERWQPSKTKVGDCPNVIGYHRNEKFVPERFLYEDTINWGNHAQWGGGRSVMLATMRILFLLGFRNVYLLGVDFDMTDDKRYHFDEQRTNSAVKGNQSTYSKMIQWFEQLQPRFLAEGFVVSNCNPDSKLRAFPFVDLDEAVRRATFELGDVVNERTWGMYTKIEEKMAAYSAAHPGAPPAPPAET